MLHHRRQPSQRHQRSCTDPCLAVGGASQGYRRTLAPHRLASAYTPPATSAQASASASASTSASSPAVPSGRTSNTPAAALRCEYRHRCPCTVASAVQRDVACHSNRQKPWGQLSTTPHQNTADHPGSRQPGGRTGHCCAASAAAASDGHQGPTSQQPGPLSALTETAWKLLAPIVSFCTKYRELLQRGLVTVAMLCILRVGMFIPIPGVDLAMLQSGGGMSAGERMIRVLYGQAQVLPASLYDLGISPYINSSILLTILLVVPAQLFPFQWLTQLKEARKEGKTGEAQINLYMNGFALLFAIYSACLRAFQLQPYALFTSNFIPATTLTLVAGSCITNYCANVITSSGIGNGSSLVICTNIVTEYAQALHTVLVGLETGLFPLAKLLPLTLGYMALVQFAVFLSTSLMKLPIVQYSSDVLGASQDAESQGLMSYEADFINARHMAKRKAAQRSERKEYFPIPLNSQGMMPVIMAGALYFGFLPMALSFMGLHAVHANLLAVQSSITGLLFYGLLIFTLEFVPFGGINPKETSDYLSQMNVGIKGIIPGEATELHLKHSLLRCKFWGGLALGTLAVLAHLFDLMCQAQLGTTMGTTSLLIIVGTVMQTSRQVEVLLERPRVQEKLQREQTLIQSLRLL